MTCQQFIPIPFQGAIVVGSSSAPLAYCRVRLRRRIPRRLDIILELKSELNKPAGRILNYLLPCPTMRQNDSFIPHLRGPVPLIHLLARQFVHPGSRVVDATCGNGKDTLVLAELVGTEGHVSAFDIQQTALERTSVRLAEAGLSNHVSLFATGHERIAELVSAPLAAIVFNLGWLPGGDRTVITRPETTQTALEASLGLLGPGGVILLTCYPGHHGGDDETGNLLEWTTALPPRDWHVWRMGQMNVSAEAPFCLVIQKGSFLNVP